MIWPSPFIWDAVLRSLFWFLGAFGMHVKSCKEDWKGQGQTHTGAEWASGHVPSSIFVVIVLSLSRVRPHGLQHARLPCPSLSPGICSNSCPLNWWCHPTISSSVSPFSCPQSSPASGCFPRSQFFPSGGQSTGVSASVLPMNIQDWFPLGRTSLISLLSKGLSRVFSSTTVQKYQFFSVRLSLWPNSHIHTHCWKNHSFD